MLNGVPLVQTIGTDWTFLLGKASPQSSHELAVQLGPIPSKLICSLKPWTSGFQTKSIPPFKLISIFSFL